MKTDIKPKQREKNELEKAISIFPNPVNGILKIDVKSSNIKLTEVAVSDLQGKILLTKTSGFNSIDMSKLSSGLYLVKIKTVNSSILKKVIKE